MTINEILKYGTSKLKIVKIESPELFNSPYLDATIILQHILKKNREFIYTNLNSKLEKSDIKKYKKLLKKRANGIPVAYITNEKEFYGLNFFVNGNVLIPRPDTEILTENAIEIIRQKNLKSCLDLCTGSGCIAISIKNSLPFIDISASDISRKSLKVAKKNIDNFSLKIELIKSNLFRKINKTFDVIVSNPPYIEKNYFNKIKKDLFEPKKALYGKSADGLKIIKKIVLHGKNYLNNNGYLFLEADEKQILKIKNFMVENSYKNVKIIKDISEKNRVIYGNIVK